MKKIFIKKILVVLLLMSLGTIINNGCVQATGEEQINPDLNEILESEEKIMMYDAKTNKTTEVDMEQLRNELSRKKSSTVKTTQDSIRFEPYVVQPEKQNLFRQLFRTHDIKLDIVPNTSYQPYNNVCKTKTAEGIGGTAALIGPNIALTAAHCVFNNNNAQYRNWTIYAGYNGENGTNGSWEGTACGWSQVYYSNKWMETHANNYDWAICVLEENVGNQLGYFGLEYYDSASSLNEKEIRCYGYPGQSGYNGKRQYTAWGWTHRTEGDLLIYEGYGIEGMSGGPIVNLFDVGIIWGNIVANEDGGNPGNCAAHRITKDMADVISKYRN